MVHQQCKRCLFVRHCLIICEPTKSTYEERIDHWRCPRRQELTNHRTTELVLQTNLQPEATRTCCMRIEATDMNNDGIIARATASYLCWGPSTPHFVHGRHMNCNAVVLTLSPNGGGGGRWTRFSAVEVYFVYDCAWSPKVRYWRHGGAEVLRSSPQPAKLAERR